MEVVAIDWSGAKHSAKGICLARAREGRLLELTPGWSREHIIETVLEIGRSASEPLVVGIDFSFSLPLWFMKARGVGSAKELWELLEKEGEEWLEVCEPPFWGRKGKRKPFLEEHFRFTEMSIGRIGGIGAKSTFQIGGTGSVGTGSIRGMPFLLRLQEAGFSIWPFDPPEFPVVVEMYPRLLTGPVIKSSLAARQKYLAGMPTESIGPDLFEFAVNSEDAFDAAVSATVMSRHSQALMSLRNDVDDRTRLEGEIWVPPRTKAGWQLGG